MAETPPPQTEPYGADFWSALYRSGDTRFDKGRVAPPIARMARAGDIPRGRVLVPGGGRGHDALALAQLGFAVTVVDIAPEACEAAVSAARALDVPLEVRCEDVLVETLAARRGTFDAIVEHTFFCAIDPSRRPEYVDACAELLRPGGVLTGLFFVLGRPGGPPFDVTEPEIRGLFGPRFALERLRLAADSFPERLGRELEARFLRTR
ncbi:MAG TPA: methyltransferase domain-containing protein [Myxococcaceae bacterium]|nr:methyltransferase domain-containing protein [Myxococcaceae bacterium]